MHIDNDNRTGFSMNELDRALRSNDRGVPHSCHWGAFSVRRTLAASKSCRIRATLIRRRCSTIFRPRRPPRADRPADGPRGWLEHGPGPDRRRGRDDSSRWTGRRRSICCGELRRVYDRYGARSGVRRLLRLGERRAFPHAQSQMHRFLNSPAATCAR